MVHVQATASFFSKLFDINRTLTTVESFFLSEATFAFAQMSLKNHHFRQFQNMTLFTLAVTRLVIFNALPQKSLCRVTLCWLVHLCSISQSRATALSYFAQNTLNSSPQTGATWLTKGEFFISGRKFVPGRNWGWKAVDENLKFLLFLYSKNNKLHNEIGLDRNVCSAQGQAALNAVTDVTKESVWFIIVYCFFTVSSVKYLQLSFFVIVVGEEFALFGFVRGEYEKCFENQCTSLQRKRKLEKRSWHNSAHWKQLSCKRYWQKIKPMITTCKWSSTSTF